jgi:hypothetical protein
MGSSRAVTGEGARFMIYKVGKGRSGGMIPIYIPIWARSNIPNI